MMVQMMRRRSRRKPGGTNLQLKWRTGGRHEADRDVGAKQQKGQQQNAGR
jgi:hypothetical protein